MDFVRAVRKPQRACACVRIGQREVRRQPRRAVGLNRPVDDLTRHVGRDDLDHRDFRTRCFVADRIHHVGRLEREQAGLLDQAACFADALAGHALRRDRFAERDSREGAPAHQRKGALRQTDQTHAMVDAARTEASLRDFETASLAKEDAACGHAHVVEHDLHVTVRGVVVTEHGQRAHARDAFGIGGNEDHRLLGVLRGVRVGLAHDDVEGAARVARPRRPPFAAADDVIVAVAPDAALHVGGVARCDIRLRHQKRRTNLAAQQRFEPLSLLLDGGVALQRLHVAGVGRIAVEDFRGPGHLSHDLAQRRVFDVGQPRTVPGIGQKQVPQSRLLRERLEALDDLRRLPRVAITARDLDLFEIALFVRKNMLVEERRQTRTQRFDFRAVAEIHEISVR